jgi:magnesium transporter
MSVHRQAPRSVARRRRLSADLPLPRSLDPGAFRISATCFEPAGLSRHAIESPTQLQRLLQAGHPLWLQIQGLRQLQAIRPFLELLPLPVELLPALLELSLASQIETDGQHVVLHLHRLQFGRHPTQLQSEQVNLLLAPDLLISLEECIKPNAFDVLNRWLDNLSPPPTAADLDDILHFLVDELLDEVFPLLESLSDDLNLIEEQTVGNVQASLLRRVYNLRTNLRAIKQQIWPLRHQIKVLLRRSQRLISDEALDGFRDMAQHVEQLVDQTEILRHQCEAITATYMANSANRMNQVMKTLAILSSIFTPISFIAGIYGMNFSSIPTTQQPWGYAACLLMMTAIALMQSLYLWRRGWFKDWSVGEHLRR